jgi:hypothetical protein
VVIIIAGKFEEKLPHMSMVGNVPDMAWNKVMFGSRHWQQSQFSENPTFERLLNQWIDSVRSL